MFYQYNHLGSPDYLKIEKGENFSFPPHLHQCFEIIVVLSGKMDVTVDNKSFNLQKGQAVMIFPNQIHSLASSESQHILCIFSPNLVKSYFTKISDRTPENCKFHPDGYLVTALESLSATASSTEKKGVLYSLCAQFDKTATYKKKTLDNDDLLYRIFLFVEGNFNGDCSLNYMSKQIGYDYSYLSRYFKKTIGIPFNSYVTHYRLSHACYLMESTQMPVVECAFDSGFASLRSFNRCFKEQFNLTPTQYRNSFKI